MAFPGTLHATGYSITIHLNGHPLDENSEDDPQVFVTGYPLSTVWDEVEEWNKEFENKTRFFMAGGQDQIYDCGGDLISTFERRDFFITQVEHWTFDVVPNFN